VRYHSKISLNNQYILLKMKDRKVKHSFGGKSSERGKVKVEGEGG
jgi:hypothetical protein